MAVDIVILGPPGAGKGTQSQRVAAGFGLAHISTGDLLRQHIADETAIGVKVKGLLDSGHLAPNELTYGVVEERLAQPDCAAGCVFDGFPRSVEQAEVLDEMLAHLGRNVTMAIFIDVDDDEVVERLAARRSCPVCGRIYNLRFDPPLSDSKCDTPDCGGQALEQREDDREDVIRERLRVYHGYDDPILRYYAAQDKLRTIKGNGLLFDGVYEKIESLLNSADPAIVS